MLHQLADSASIVPDLPPVVNEILQYGILGIVLILLLTGYLVTKPYLDHVKAEVKTWKQNYYDERDAHDETREALETSIKSNESTQESVKTLTSLLRGVGHKGVNDEAV